VTSLATRVPPQRDAYQVVRAYPWCPHRASGSCCGNYRRALAKAKAYRDKPAPVGTVVLIYAPRGQVRHRWSWDAAGFWRVEERVDIPNEPWGAKP